MLQASGMGSAEMERDTVASLEKLIVEQGYLFMYLFIYSAPVNKRGTIEAPGPGVQVEGRPAGWRRRWCRGLV